MPDRPANSFDADTGYSGQDYHVDRERDEGAKLPSGSVGTDKPKLTKAPEFDPAIPPEDGRRASFDPDTGEVHGSGSGTGGGNPGENMDDDENRADGLS